MRWRVFPTITSYRATTGRQRQNTWTSEKETFPCAIHSCLVLLPKIKHWAHFGHTAGCFNGNLVVVSRVLPGPEWRNWQTRWEGHHKTQSLVLWSECDFPCCESISHQLPLRQVRRQQQAVVSWQHLLVTQVNQPGSNQFVDRPGTAEKIVRAAMPRPPARKKWRREMPSQYGFALFRATVSIAPLRVARQTRSFHNLRTVVSILP